MKNKCISEVLITGFM